MPSVPETPPLPSIRRQAAFVAVYFPLYIAYLFVHPEGELLHWVSLVALPLACLAAAGPYASAGPLLRSIGLDRTHPARGFGWVLVLGAGFQGLQLLNTRQREEVASLLAGPLGFLLPFAALGLLVVTVATTEEVFFRGIVQQRLTAWIGNAPAAWLVTTAAFVVYHVPYAYLSPAWPSAGDPFAAVRLAAVNGGIGGLALGLVYWRSRGNLAAAIALHALIDLMPAIRLLGKMMG